MNGASREALQGDATTDRRTAEDGNLVGLAYSQQGRKMEVK